MVLIISQKDVETLVNMKEVIEAVERAHAELYKGHVVCPQKVKVDIEKHKGFAFYMPVYLAETDALAIKIVTQYEENLPKYNLPTVVASILLNDTKTGVPLAFMEGTYITALRTGAVSGVATKYLARKDSETVGVLGTGVQAKTQLWALGEVLKKIKKVKVYDIFVDRAKKYAEEMSKRLKLNVEVAKTSRQCVENSDIVVESTTSKEPVVKGDWIREGVHINSIGYMGPEYAMLDIETIKKAKVVVTNKQDALKYIGDFSIPIEKGLISKDHIYADLGEVVSGIKAGRASEKEITLFKSMGLAVEDGATAKLVYEKTLKMKAGIDVALVK